MQADLAVTGDWGGFASVQALLDQDFTRQTVSVVIDPFAFLQEALHLPTIPVPNVTTENGRRILTVHLDGDGFMEKFETPGDGYASEILLRNIFLKYRVPHTISVIEGETGPEGLYPKISADLEKIAREIYALDHVEAATHTFSHPYNWAAASAGDNEESDRYRLPINGYSFTLEREIAGSANYINSRLLPEGKKATVVLWTGNCVPTPEAVALATSAGLLNMNGGDTLISELDHSLTKVMGMGVRLGNGEYQVFAPITNENIFTNLWTGPFYGYRRVIESFKKTERPRRLKPIGIYYHFYSGAKHASLKALQTVYDWTLGQEINPMFASEYIRKVLAYQQVGIARDGNGQWKISGMDEIKTLRLPPGMGWPQRTDQARGIAGWRQLHDGVYLHIGEGLAAEFSLGKKPADTVRLVQANGKIVKWAEKRWRCRFQAYRAPAADA